MPRVFLASRNAKKVDEMQRILAEFVPHIEVLGVDACPDYVEPREDQPDFAGNALLKARAGVAATGLPSLADDSGLCVDALGGMPGVLSARWAGRDKDDLANNELLLDQLYDVPDARRAAHFTCAVAWCVPTDEGATCRVVEGRMDGRIIREMRGTGGFGYDVVFVPEGESRTSAELPPDEKDAISHRGRALRKIAPLVAQSLRP
jgi:XTP/dITP diphosphohydrolase